MPTTLENIVFGSVDTRRLIQDTPVQGDVWLEFAKGPGQVDLLLVPDRGQTAGSAAADLRQRIAEAGCTAKIAQLPGIIAARMDLRAFLTCVVPAMTWWRKCAGDPGARGCDAQRTWLAQVAAQLGYNEAVPDGKDPAIIGRVGLNRKFTPAATQSCQTVKADAARQLFGITCKDITWAVLDTGIHSGHPAFIDRCKPGSSRVVATYDFVGLIDRLDLIASGAKSAARDTVMLRLRANLRVEAELASETPDDAALEWRARDRLRRLRERLQAGRDLDWTLFEAFVKVPAPALPSSDHGTQVAGIIGGDWQVAEGAPDGMPMTGMCPDIKLIDMRVIGDGGGGDGGGGELQSTEFDVIAALQFLRFLNDRSEPRKFAVHGANLSLSTPHDVRMYGCGSTLVCDECDRLSASGVVVVTCSGNGGHVGSTNGDGGQYQAMSITDPGNAALVITVGATHALQPHRYGVSWFSGRGPTGDGRCKPDIVAPGERIVAPRVDTGSAEEGTGTSFAAPHVSGAAALLMARNNELAGQSARIKAILCATATDLGRERHFQGAGLLDTLRALQSV